MSVLSVFAIAFLLGTIPACGSSHTKTPDDGVSEESELKYVAHRGYSHSYLANTEEAFRAAAGMSFFGIETDIRKTQDGYYVCNHDATVKYANGSEVTISTTDRADLLAQPLQNDVTNRDAYLCTFETYLQACKSGNKVAVIELKDHFNKREIAEILSIIDAEYDRKHVYFISFIYSCLRNVKETDPSIKLQYLSQTKNDFLFENCLEDGISVSVRQTILTEELVMLFHDEGLEVNVWTVNEESYLEKARKMGVDYVTTDIFCEE